MRMELAVLWLVMGVLMGARGAGRDVSLVATPASFAVETTVLVNDVARKDRELGYKVKTRLEVRPVYRHEDELLLHLQLKEPKLYLRGKHPNAEFLARPSLWDDVAPTPFYVHWSEGIIRAAYLDPQDPLDVFNYKKSIISLFQFNLMDGEHNETDISGDCTVLYETMSDNVFRKFKKQCSGDASPASVRRVSRYTRDGAGGPLAQLHAEELVTVGEGAPGLGLKARAWHALSRVGGADAAPLAASLDAALAALPAALSPTALPLTLPTPSPFDTTEDWRAELEAHRDQLEREGAGEAGGGGDAATALTFLRVAGALRGAPPAPLRAFLADPANHRVLGGVCRALGLAGSRAALAALDEVLHLRAGDAPAHLATAYLEGFALSDSPEGAAVAEVLRVGEEAASAAVSASALLAAAAAAHTLHARGEPAPSLTVREALLKSLARSKEEEGAATRLRALANLRRADTVEPLVENARRGATAPRAALAALDALAALPPRALSYAHLERVAHAALERRAPLEVRAAALQLALAGWTRPPGVANPVARMARALHEHAPQELRRVFWQRLRALAATHAHVRDLLPRLHPTLRSWDALALNGTSSVLSRETGWGAGGWRTALDSAQVAQGGLLRRGQVRLSATSPAGLDADLVAVEMWTRGMEAFAAGADTGEPEEGAPSPAAGLAFAVAGVRMRGGSLFDGQAELLGHVWAGTGSAPTPALRAAVPLGAGRATLPLAAGVPLRVEWTAGAAFAIDAHAQVSLWWRTARAALELRAAAAASARMALAPAWGEVRAEASAALEPRLHIAADLDFYDAVALCVRVRTDDHLATRNLTLLSVQGDRRLRVSRSSATALPRPGRTLALGAPNDVVCRTLRAADAGDDAAADE